MLRKICLVFHTQKYGAQESSFLMKPILMCNYFSTGHGRYFIIMFVNNNV